MADMPRLVPFGSTRTLVELLDLKAPPFARTDPFRQLGYLVDYLSSMKCGSMLLEPHYVDRDFIEDYSLFYSRNLHHYKNFCQRLHFFGADPATIRSELRELLADIRDRPIEFPRRAQEFSRSRYLGFTVIKPLPGSPVGRTVFQCFSDKPTDLPEQTRDFSGARRYAVHLGPVTLNVTGLAFQQQDVGVSACATTALWCALHKVRDFEEIGAPTPAQITTLATRYSLPFGRPMPSDEGLSMDQMCQALQALQVAPHVLRAQQFQTGRSYVYSALRSQFAPVLVISSETNPNLRHAVTAVGQRLAPLRVAAPTDPVDASEGLLALYVNDDRVGPYLRMNVIARNNRLLLETVRHGNPLDRWFLDFVLLPLHPKIRLSIGNLREITLRFVKDLYDRLTALDGPVHFEHWFARTPAYLRDLVSRVNTDQIALVDQISEKLELPRYLGVSRITGPKFGTIDLLLDSTSTMKNLSCIAVVGVLTTDAIDCEAIASSYDCVAIISRPSL